MKVLHRTAARNLMFSATIMAGALAPFAGASAGTIAAMEVANDTALLNQFNLVTSYYATGGAVSTAGRVIAGSANLANGTTVCASCTGNATPGIDSTGQTYGALTVFGNLAGNGSVNVNKGNVSVGGTTSLTVNMQGSGGAFKTVGSTSAANVQNAGSVTAYKSYAGKVNGASGGAAISQSLAAVFPFTSYGLVNQANNLAAGIAALPGTPGVSAKALPKAINGFFTATNDYVANGMKYGVVTVSLADLAGDTNFKGIDNSVANNDAVFVIVTGDVMTSTSSGYNASYVLPNLNSYIAAKKVIFDFVDATTLKFAGNWNGSILAPLANITSANGVLDGSIIVASINQTQALGAANLFVGNLTGLVPEPASLLLFGVGAAAAGLVRRRRSKA